MKIVLLKKLLLLLISSSYTVFSYSHADTVSSKFPSVKWIESNEYNLLCYQIYQLAKQNFSTLDNNKSFSAMLEQKSTDNLSPAVIVDIDETILLNLEFRKETVEKDGKFSQEIWENNIKRKTAIPISGSIDYLNYLSENGVKTLYVSNREAGSEEKTFELLKELGYPISNKEDILLRNEKKEWVRNKTSRRTYIASKYRVIQIFGDSLRDFAETNEQATANKDKFGKSWFLLPNPIYGTWLNTSAKITKSKKVFSSYNNLQSNRDRLFHLEIETIANEIAHGSAVALGKDGRLVTAYHVIEHASSIKAVDSMGMEYIANVEKVSLEHDLAYLKIKPNNKELTNISTNQPKWSEEVYTLDGKGTLLKGIVSRHDKNDIVVNFEVPKGMSGGGLFNSLGELLGVVSRTSINQGITYIAPIGKFDLITEKFTQKSAIDHSSNNYDYSYCAEESTLQSWKNLTKTDSIEVHELHALFLGLCEKVKRKEITTEVADYLFFKQRDELMKSQKK